MNIKQIGLQNQGNTCYMNSGLQALLASSLLNRTIITYFKTNPTNINNVSIMLKEYCRLIVDVSTSTVPSYRPQKFKNALDIENKSFRGSAQHDANEFLVYLLNEFVDEKKDPGIAQAIRQLCFGKYKQYIFCTECRTVVENYFNFLDIVLPIPDKNIVDISDCFEYMAGYETLDDVNKWNCPKCNKKTVARKKIEIINVPDLTILTFNRFRGSGKNNKPIKIYHKIDLEGVHLKLIATVNHYGSLGGGHYTANILKNNTWFLANDSSLHGVNDTSMLYDPSVYMAIYERYVP